LKLANVGAKWIDGYSYKSNKFYRRESLKKLKDASISALASFPAAGRFFPVFSGLQAAFGTVVFEPRRVSESRNKLSEDGVIKDFEN
jgi:hypothetical protein